MSDAELVAWFRGHAPELRRMFAEHLYITYCSTVPLGVIQSVCTAIDDPTMAMTLVSGIGGVDSAAPSYAFWEMGRMVRASASLTAAFDAGVDDLLSRLRAADDADTKAFLRAFDEFLYEFGSRGPNEWETSAPSWETDPELPLAAIDRMRLADDDHAPLRHQEAMAAAREAAIPGVLAAVEDDPETHGQLSAALAAAPVFLAGRERTKTNIIRLVNEMRVGSHALGQRMVERGYYTKPTSGSMLSDEELDQFLADPGAWVDTIKEREAQYEGLFDLEPPFVFAGEVPPLRTWEERETEPTPVAQGTTLEGIPGCPGQATGRARVVLDPSDPTAPRARRRAHRADHRPGVDAAVRAGRGCRRRRRRAAQPRDHRVPRARHPVRGVGHRRHPPHPRRRPGHRRRHRGHGHALSRRTSVKSTASGGVRRVRSVTMSVKSTASGGVHDESSLLGEGGLQVGQDGDGAGVDAGFGGEVQAHEVALDDEVEELREGALSLGLDVDDAVHDLVEDVVGEVEAAGDLWVLEVVAEPHHGHHLAGDVAVLAPPADLVVGHLGERARRTPAPWRSRSPGT